jgi:DNA gyrase subunit A
VTDENDLMIINKSGITIRMKMADLNVIGRATQGVRLINLGKRNDEIASVCKVMSEIEEEVIAGTLELADETVLPNEILPIEETNETENTLIHPDEYEEENPETR